MHLIIREGCRPFLRGLLQRGSTSLISLVFHKIFSVGFFSFGRSKLCPPQPLEDSLIIIENTLWVFSDIAALKCSILTQELSKSK